MSRCIFCEIVAGRVPATVLLDEQDVVAFRDSNPQAPTHVLVVPRRHVPSVRGLAAGDAGLWWSVLDAARRVAEREGVGDGFRLVTNTGGQAGQTVDHLHLHVLGGRPMGWPPG